MKKGKVISLFITFSYLCLITSSSSHVKALEVDRDKAWVESFRESGGGIRLSSGVGSFQESGVGSSSVNIDGHGRFLRGGGGGHGGGGSHGGGGGSSHGGGSRGGGSKGSGSHGGSGGHIWPRGSGQGNHRSHQESLYVPVRAIFASSIILVIIHCLS